MPSERIGARFRVLTPTLTKIWQSSLRGWRKMIVDFRTNFKWRKLPKWFRRFLLAGALFLCAVIVLLMPWTSATSPRVQRLDPKTRPVNKPLIEAISAGNIDSVRSILNAGASADSVKEQAEDPFGALSAAVSTNRMDMVKLLVEHGADINNESEWGATDIMGAVAKGNPEMVQYFLDHGADPNANDDGATVLAQAITWGGSFTQRVQIIYKLKIAGAHGFFGFNAVF